MSIFCLGLGVALMWLVIFAAESSDKSVRMVFRSRWGAAVYFIGLVAFVAGVIS